MKGRSYFCDIIMMLVLQSLSASDEDVLLFLQKERMWIWCPLPNPLYDYTEVRNM